MRYKFYSTKTYHNLGPVAYRQWKADSHCNLIHGYALSFHFVFGTDTLDARSWAIDFGSLRPLRDLLEDWFDHTYLLAVDDPEYNFIKQLHDRGIAKIVEVEKTGCEGIADFLYNYINDPKDGFLRQLAGDRDIWCTEVHVRETPSNMAMRCGTPDLWNENYG